MLKTATYDIPTGLFEDGNDFLLIENAFSYTLIVTFETIGIDSQVDIAFLEGNEPDVSKMTEITDALNRDISQSINTDGIKITKLNTFDGISGALKPDKLAATTGTIKIIARTGDILKVG